MLDEGELALVADGGGLDAISELAHRLDLLTVTLLRSERHPEQLAATIMRFAGSKPLVWVAPAFGEATVAWAHARGPMTLLVESADALTEDERKRVERFVVILGRQAE